MSHNPMLAACKKKTKNTQTLKIIAECELRKGQVNGYFETMQ